MAKKQTVPDLVPEAKRPYSIPENWQWTRIGNINQYVPHSVDPSQCPDNMFELYSVPSSVDNYPEIIPGSEIGSTKQSVKKNDVLLCKINPRINRVWIVSQHTSNELLASSEWIIIRNQRINMGYLMYWLKSPVFREFMLSHVSGVGGSLMRTQPKYVKQYPVPVAPLPEQQRIVDRIEKLFAMLDEARDKAQAVVDGYELRRAAILYKAFTGELTAKWREECGIRFDSWKHYLYGELGESKLGKMLDIKKNIGKPVKYLRNTNVRWFSFDLSDIHTMLATEEEIQNLYIRKGDLYICEGGEPGRCAVWNNEDINDIIFQKAIHRFHPHKGVISDFIAYYLFYISMNGTIDYYFTGSTIKHLTGKALAKIPIYLPTTQEQKEIVRILDKSLEQEQQAKISAEKILETIDIMKKKILGLAFRGLLGTNDPAEPCAETGG